MSTTSVRPTTATLDAELNALVLSGKALEAFDRFYADDVVMQENDAPPVVGKAANREREIAFFESIETWHDAQVLGSSVSGDRSFSEWLLDLTFKNGVRVRSQQVAARRWKNGQVVSERFYYNSGK